MRIPGLKSINLSARWFRSRFFKKTLILGYHSVAENSRDPYSISVKPKHFVEHLEVLRKNTTPISLDKLVHALEKNELPKRAVAITFDDGYSDNLYEAKHYLEELELPATVFITTGYIGNQFWWDKLERILYTPESLPAKLNLEINDTVYNWSLDEIADRSIKTGNSDLRLNLLLTIYRHLLPMSLNDRQNALEQLSSWTGELIDQGLIRRALTADEIIELTKGGLIGIGAHSVTHPILAKLPEEKQELEIRQSKTYLENLLNSQITCFSYPHGNPSKETISLVKKSGYICACASHKDVTWQGSDHFQLPRFWIQDWDRNQFSRWLDRWLGNKKI